MPKCRHAVQDNNNKNPNEGYDYIQRCRSSKTEPKRYTLDGIKVGDCISNKTIYRDDKKAIEECPMHEKFED